MRSNRAVLGKVVRRWTQQTMCRAWEDWRCNTEEARRHRLIISTVVQRWQGVVLRPVFELWMLHIQRQRLIVDSMFRWGLIGANRAFVRWSCMCLELKRQRTLVSK
eukprot:3871690-Rhodomonas_salina.1